jgi:DNA-binding transcriptional regulator YiaG
MTHLQFGAALGVKGQTAQRWEIDAGKPSHRAPSETVIRLLQVLLATSNVGTLTRAAVTRCNEEGE